MLMILAAIEEEYGKLNASELEDLMQGLVRGDQEALSQLYHYARTAVYGLALSIVRHGKRRSNTAHREPLWLGSYPLHAIWR